MKYSTCDTAASLYLLRQIHTVPIPMMNAKLWASRPLHLNAVSELRMLVSRLLFEVIYDLRY